MAPDTISVQLLRWIMSMVSPSSFQTEWGMWWTANSTAVTRMESNPRGIIKVPAPVMFFMDGTIRCDCTVMY